MHHVLSDDRRGATFNWLPIGSESITWSSSDQQYRVVINRSCVRILPFYCQVWFAFSLAGISSRCGESADTRNSVARTVNQLDPASKNWTLIIHATRFSSPFTQKNPIKYLQIPIFVCNEIAYQFTVYTIRWSPHKFHEITSQLAAASLGQYKGNQKTVEMVAAAKALQRPDTPYAIGSS